MRHATMATALLAAGLGLTGCASEYGYGGGVAAGYGYPDGYGYGGYDAGYADYYDGAYGAPYWGWYGDYYYPGSGIFVFDRYRRPVRWNGAQQRYWQGRLSGWRGHRGGPEWRGFDRRDAAGLYRPGIGSSQVSGGGFRGAGQFGRREGGQGLSRPAGVPGEGQPGGSQGAFGYRGGAVPFARPGQGTPGVGRGFPGGPGQGFARPQGGRQAPASGGAPRTGGGNHGGGGGYHGGGGGGHPHGPR